MYLPAKALRGTFQQAKGIKKKEVAAMVGNRVPAGPLPLQRSRQKAANLQSGPSTPTSISPAELILYVLDDKAVHILFRFMEQEQEAHQLDKIHDR